MLARCPDEVHERRMEAVHGRSGSYVLGQRLPPGRNAGKVARVVDLTSGHHLSAVIASVRHEIRVRADRRQAGGGSRGVDLREEVSLGPGMSRKRHAHRHHCEGDDDDGNLASGAHGSSRTRRASDLTLSVSGGSGVFFTSSPPSRGRAQPESVLRSRSRRRRCSDLPCRRGPDPLRRDGPTGGRRQTRRGTGLP